jgi:polysaccharide biosynthesis/export protein
MSWISISVTVPYVGGVQAKGKTLEEFQKNLTASLGAFMQYPVVSVSLRQSKSRLFFVYGEVAKPGEYSLLRGDLTVLRAIAMAGGLTQRAWPVNVQVVRKGKEGKPENLSVNLKKAEWDPSLDLPVMPGDMITVPEGRFFVYGEVAHPGEFPAQHDVTVMRAIAMAGGMTKFGSASNVKLIRPRGDGRSDTIPVSLKGIENDPSSDEAVLPGDVIYVMEGSF